MTKVFRKCSDFPQTLELYLNWTVLVPNSREGGRVLIALGDTGRWVDTKIICAASQCVQCHVADLPQVGWSGGTTGGGWPFQRKHHSEQLFCKANSIPVRPERMGRWMTPTIVITLTRSNLKAQCAQWKSSDRSPDTYFMHLWLELPRLQSEYLWYTL